MRKFWSAVIFLALLAAPAFGQQPTVVVRVRSLNALLENLNLVVRLVGQEQQANQIEALVKSKIGKQGLEGIDPERPFGAYVRFGKDIDDIAGAILVPMADPKTFLTLLDNVGVNVSKDKDGIYTHKTTKNFNLYFRFAHQYLYLTSINTDSLQERNLVDPAKVLDIPGNATVSMLARVEQIPDAAKQIALGQLEETLLAMQKKRGPGETKVQEEFRIALLREANRLGAGLIREAAEVRFDLDVSDRTKELTVNLTVTAKPDSATAKTIQELGTLQSPLAGALKDKVAFTGGVHLQLPEPLSKAFAAVIDEAAERSIEGINDKQKQKDAEALFKALLPTAQSQEMQLVAAVLGPEDKHYTFAAALKLKDGVKLGKTVHGLLKDALKTIPEDQRDRYQLDFAKIDGIAIHRFLLPKDDRFDKFVTEIAGDKHLYLAFREDALLLTLGKEALPALKTLATRKDQTASQPLLFDFDVARMAPLMAQTPEQKALADKLFAGGQDGRVRLTLEGGPALRLRLQMRLSALEFLVKMKNDKDGK